MISAKEFKEKQVSKVTHWENILMESVEEAIEKLFRNDTPALEVSVSFLSLFKCNPYNGDEREYFFHPKYPSSNSDHFETLKGDSFLVNVINRLLSLGYVVNIIDTMMYVSVEEKDNIL